VEQQKSNSQNQFNGSEKNAHFRYLYLMPINLMIFSWDFKKKGA
jgi:hypothetical protein